MKPCSPYVNQSTHEKGKQGTKWKDPCPRRQMNHMFFGFLSQWPYVLEAVFWFSSSKFLIFLKVASHCWKMKISILTLEKNHVFPSFPPKKFGKITIKIIVYKNGDASVFIWLTTHFISSMSTLIGQHCISSSWYHISSSLHPFLWSWHKVPLANMH